MPAVNKTCYSGQFQCADGACIFARYLCDRFPDCRDGSDESKELCGDDPCRDRIKCGDHGRCIPISWCCHRPSSIPDGPYDCDYWKRQLCCDRPAISDQSPFMAGTWEDKTGISSYSIHDPKRSAYAGSTNGHGAVWGFQSAIFVVAGCTLAFVALILLASYLGAKYLVRKLHRQHEQLERERHHHRSARHASNAPGHSCRSHSPSRPTSIANGRGPALQFCRSSLDDNEILRVYFLNSDRSGRQSLCGNDHSCSLLLRYQSHVASESDAITESPPPPYVDAAEPPPDYASLPQHSATDDGLPGYTSALELIGRKSIESSDQ